MTTEFEHEPMRGLRYFVQRKKKKKKKKKERKKEKFSLFLTLFSQIREASAGVTRRQEKKEEFIFFPKIKKKERERDREKEERERAFALRRRNRKRKDGGKEGVCGLG